MEQSAVGAGGGLDRRDLVAIVAALAVALLLRVFNLAATFPAVDEYYHLIAAQQLLRGAAAGSVYPRGLLLVTMPVSFALRIFGHQIWAARLVGVLFNTLAIIPLYLLGEEDQSADCPAVLRAAMPSARGSSRLREWRGSTPSTRSTSTGSSMRWCCSWKPFRRVSSWFAIGRRSRGPRAIVLAALLCLPPWFGLTIDWLSTFRTILIAYVVLGVVAAGEIRLERPAKLANPGRAAGRHRVRGARLVPGAGQQIAAVAQNQRRAAPVFPAESSATVVFRSRRCSHCAGSARRCGLLLHRPAERHSSRRSCICCLGAYLAVFTFLSKTFFHTRHLLTTELWYVVVTAIGLYARLDDDPGGRTSGKPRAPGGFGTCSWGLRSPIRSQILLPSASTNPDMPISEDYLHDMSKIQEFMLGHAQANDVLISTVYGLYASWEDEPKFSAQYRINSATPKEDLLQIVESNPSGWIVIDKIRLDLSPLSARDFSGLDQIEYIGMFGDEYVWRWQRASGWAPAPVGTRMTSMKLSLVIPVYNEQATLPPLFEAISKALSPGYDPWEVIFVDDGSTDASLDILRELAAKEPEHVRVIVYRRNFGQTAAIAGGLDNSRGEIIVLLDADFQNDPADIPLLLAKLDEGYDVVSGWRKSRKDNAFTRTLPSVLANALISAVTGVHLHDYGCTLKAYRRSALEGFRLYGEMHRFIPVFASSIGAGSPRSRCDTTRVASGRPSTDLTGP